MCKNLKRSGPNLIQTNHLVPFPYIIKIARYFIDFNQVLNQILNKFIAFKQYSIIKHKNSSLITSSKSWTQTDNSPIKLFFNLREIKSWLRFDRLMMGSLKPPEIFENFPKINFCTFFYLKDDENVVVFEISLVEVLVQNGLKSVTFLSDVTSCLIRFVI